jgi:protease I
MELAGKRVAVLIEELWNEFEVIYPLLRLREAGAEAILVGSGRLPTYPSKAGLSIAAQRSIMEVQPAELDGVIVPGGFAPDYLRRVPRVVSLVRTLSEQGKLVAAICHGGWLLSSANIAAGRTLTSAESIRDDLVHAGAGWMDEEVVVDGNLITSRKPDDLPAFMRQVIRLLAEGPRRPSPGGAQRPRKSSRVKRATRG